MIAEKHIHRRRPIMSAIITEQSILEALRRLPQERWTDVLNFIQSQGLPSAKSEATGSRPMTADDLLASGLVGMWKDRTDIGDNHEFARQLREQAQTRDRE
jgi:hypothetical protein